MWAMGSLVHWWQKCKLVQSLWKTISHYLLRRNIYIHTAYNPEVYSEIQQKCSHMCTKRYVNSNIIHYGQKMETTQMSISSGLDKLRYMHKMGRYTAMETNQLQLYAAPRMTLTWLKISQIEPMCYTISFI